jgi:hypothetical protein
MSCENVLGIPKEFGNAGIQVGNMVSEAVSRQNRGYEAKYNLGNRKITILNTPDLSVSDLHNILYVNTLAEKYHAWYPVVQEEKDSEGNLEISLSAFPPRSEERRYRTEHIFEKESDQVSVEAALYRILQSTI